jgi:hypothetical protein
VLALVASFLAGVVVAVPATVLAGRVRPRRRATGSRPARIDERSARIEESITAFGKQLESLVFDPAAAGHTEAMLGDYQAALDAYERAKDVDTGRPDGEARVATALGKGRAALIRLDARLNHRPVPIEAIEDASAPVPELRADERFLTSGRKPGDFEILLDRPEPERYAMVGPDARVTGWPRLQRGQRASQPAFGGGRAGGDLEIVGKARQVGDPSCRAVGRKRDAHRRAQGLGVLPDLDEHANAGAVAETRRGHVHEQRGNAVIQQPDEPVAQRTRVAAVDVARKVDNGIVRGVRGGLWWLCLVPHVCQHLTPVLVWPGFWTPHIHRSGGVRLSFTLPHEQ